MQCDLMTIAPEVTSTSPAAGLLQRAGDLSHLETLHQRLLWLSCWTIHHANHLRKKDERDVKVGGHQASSASMAAILTALYFHALRPGDRVAVQAEKSPEFLFLYLGAVRAGAVFLPLNTAYTPTEIAYFLGDAEPALFVCDPAKHEALAPVARDAGVPVVHTLDARGQHRWWPMAPSSPVEVALEEPGIAWRGTAYFDTNHGDTSLEAAFRDWTWCRADLRDGAAMAAESIDSGAARARRR